VTLTIGVDVGGTKVAGGVVDEHGNVLAETRRDTPAEDQAGTRDTIVEVAAELARQYPAATAIGIGAAAWIDAAGSTVLFAPNLAWRDEPLRDYVTKAVGLPTVLENDANVAAWAEFRFGAARDADDSMVMITVGTGIGGGIVLNGGLWRGANGIAGELGHIQSVPNGHPCGRSPRRRRRATGWPGTRSRRSGTGWASRWPTSRRSSTRRCWSSAAA
jgi:glucokinase